MRISASDYRHSTFSELLHVENLLIYSRSENFPETFLKYLGDLQSTLKPLQFAVGWIHHHFQKSTDGCAERLSSNKFDMFTQRNVNLGHNLESITWAHNLERNTDLNYLFISYFCEVGSSILLAERQKSTSQILSPFCFFLWMMEVEESFFCFDGLYLYSPSPSMTMVQCALSNSL